MRSSNSAPFTRRWPLLGLAALLLVSMTVLALAWAGSSIAGAQDDGLQVSISANPANPPVNEPTTLTAAIANPPPEGKPAYDWQIDFGDGNWFSVGSNSTLRYLAGGAETLGFRVTVSYGSGETATSDPITVTWVEAGEEPTPEPTEEPTPTPEPTPEPTPVPTEEPPEPPEAPAGLTATGRDAAIELSWTDPTDRAISKYQVRVSADGGAGWDPDWTDVPGSGATTTSHTLTGLTNDTAYTIELRAVRGAASAGPAASATATPSEPAPAEEPPPTPTPEPTPEPPAPAGDYEPDPEVIDGAWTYAREMDHGHVHVLRWIRVLKTLGAVADMSAAEAQEHADTYWHVRWDPVVAELEAMEADADYAPKAEVIADVREYAQETASGFDHVLRWMRVMQTLGAIEDMSAAEAQGYADSGLQRWEPVAAELAELEAATRPNRAPVVNERAANYAKFVEEDNAPRGVYVSKMFNGIFSDPDGDELTYAVSVPADRSGLLDELDVSRVVRSGGRTFDLVFIRVDGDDDWKAVSPPLAFPLVTTVTLTATDPDGLSASVSGDFSSWWLSYPELVSATASGQAVMLTFDLEVQASPAPAPGQFTVNVVNGDGSAGTVAVSGVAVNGKVVTLELASALEQGQTVTLDYVHDDDAPLKRAADGGYSARDFTGQVSILDLPGPPQNFVVSATQVSLDLAATWDAVDGAASYKLRWRPDGGEFGADDETTVTETEATVTVSGHGRWEVHLQGCNVAGCGPAVVLQFTVEPRSGAQGYRGQLAEVLRELSLRRPAPERNDGPSKQSSHSTSIVYVIDDSGSMDGDYPEVRTALETVRDTDMPNTKVALIGFGRKYETVFELTDHSSDVWTDDRIKFFGAKLGGTLYYHPLRAARVMLRNDSAQVKKIIFITDAQLPVSQRNLDEMKRHGIVMDSVALGNHFKDRFDDLKRASLSTGGEYRMVVKPLQGTTNDPADTTRALSAILSDSVADNTATLFLVDYSGSMLMYEYEHGELDPALEAAVSAKNSATNAIVGLAAFRSGHLPYNAPPPYMVLNWIGSQSLRMGRPTSTFSGPTDVGYGLRKAHATISAATAANKRVVLLSDGITAFDMPATTLSMFGTGASDVRLDIVAWGPHADRVLMKNWADTVGGSFNVVTPITDEDDE